METVARQLAGNVRGFVNNCFWNEILMEEDQLSTREGSGEVVTMLRSETNVSTLQAVRRTLILFEEKWVTTF